MEIIITDSAFWTLTILITAILFSLSAIFCVSIKRNKGDNDNTENDVGYIYDNIMNHNIRYRLCLINGCIFLLALGFIVISILNQTNTASPNLDEATLWKHDVITNWDDINHLKSFKNWASEFGKEYANENEKNYRFSLFLKNWKMVNEFNMKNEYSFKKGLNQFSDLTHDEIQQFLGNENLFQYLRKNKLPSDTINTPKRSLLSTSHPIVDHRQFMRPVRDQGPCGSSWAFATQAVLEGCYQKWESVVLSDWFSTQQSVDCDVHNDGCNGGWFGGAFKYFTTHPLIYESNYPYKGTRGVCEEYQVSDTGIKISGYRYGYDEYSLNTMLQRGPIAAAVDANKDWFFYKSGVFDAPCKPYVNHAVVVVGYQNGYWIIRNSWGEFWGDHGHIKIKDNDNNAQSCMVERYAYQPTAFV